MFQESRGGVNLVLSLFRLTGLAGPGGHPVNFALQHYIISVILANKNEEGGRHVLGVS